MPTTRIPFAGSIVTRDPTNFAGRDQTFTNCFSYAVSDSLSGGQRIYTEKRRGIALAQTITGLLGRMRGCVWQSHTNPKLAFPFLNSGASTVGAYDEGGNLLESSTISNVNSCLGLMDTAVSGTATLVALASDSVSSALEGWYTQEGAGAWTQISDGDFPPNQGTPIPLAQATPVAMDGYLFWMTQKGQIWNSDPNSVSAYTANNFITADSMPDGGTGIARSKNYIAALGRTSIEFFRNAGKPTGSPLASVPDSVIRIGVVTFTPCTVGDSTYFQGIDAESGQRSIYQLSSASVKKISTPDIDEYLGGMSSNNAYCYGAIRQVGQDHILFGTSTSGATSGFAYTPATGRWWGWNVGLSFSVVSALGFGVTGNLSHVCSAGPYIGKIDSTASVFADNSGTLTMTIQTQALDFGTHKWKFGNRLRIIGDKIASTCNVAVSWSDDDGINFSTPVNVDMSSGSPWITRLGSFRRRVFKFVNTTNLALRLEAFELDYTVGTA